MRILADQPLDFYYPDGWQKGMLRKPLAELVNDRVAYRTDNQGLRWPRAQTLAGCENRMRKSISESGVLRNEPIKTRLIFAMKRLKLSRLVPLYEASVADRYSLRRELATWDT